MTLQQQRTLAQILPEIGRFRCEFDHQGADISHVACLPYARTLCANMRDLVAIPLYLTKLLTDTPGGNLPTTKEEVLRLFVAEIDRNAASHEVLGSVAAGFHREMLSAIAIDATVAGSVTVSERRARSIISDVAGRLVREGQMAAPQPDAVLAALVSHHLLVRTASGVEFQHQQFQEWFASHEVEALMRAAAGGNAEAR